MLLLLDGKAVGHCSSHTATINAETKDRAVKPTASTAASRGLWKEKGVTGLSVSLSAEGLHFYNETEAGYKDLLAKIYAGASIDVKCIERSGETKPYIQGKFVITSLELSAAMGEDTSYSISLENDGEVTVTAANLTQEAVPANTALVSE